MLNLKTNAIIITSNIIWLKKTYGKYKGISNLKCFGVKPDEAENELHMIKLLDDEESKENFDDQDS